MFALLQIKTCYISCRHLGICSLIKWLNLFALILLSVYGSIQNKEENGGEDGSGPDGTHFGVVVAGHWPGVGGAAQLHIRNKSIACYSK